MTDDPPSETTGAAEAYERFVGVEGLRLRRALVAHYGTEVGPEVTADALAWGWEHWTELEAMANPVGYLFRVGQSNARRHWRWRRRVCLPAEHAGERPQPEPALPAALAALPDAHRVAVLLVHGHGHSYEEAAALLDVPVSTLRNHLHRGMARLRDLLGVDDGE